MRRWLFLTAAAFVGFAGIGTSSVAAKGEQAFRVLFIGNSHLLVNNVPERVRRRLKARKRRVHIRTVATGGAHLRSFTRRASVAALIKQRWDVVVLQEASAAFLSRHGRQGFSRSIGWFAKRIHPKSRIVLYQTWPWKNGSRYLEGKATSQQMWRMMRATYRSVPRRRRITIAPVGRCWVASPRVGKLYSLDGNHATIAGSKLAARVISRAILLKKNNAC